MITIQMDARDLLDLYTLALENNALSEDARTVLKDELARYMLESGTGAVLHDTPRRNVIYRHMLRFGDKPALETRIIDVERRSDQTITQPITMAPEVLFEALETYMEVRKPQVVTLWERVEPKPTQHKKTAGDWIVQLYFTVLLPSIVALLSINWLVNAEAITAGTGIPVSALRSVGAVMLVALFLFIVLHIRTIWRNTTTKRLVARLEE